MLKKIDCTTRLSDISAGIKVTFGKYHLQDVSTSEPLQWRVLDIDDGKALLLCEQGIDCQTYHDEGTSVTWEQCTLRRWMNTDLIADIFSEEEQKLIDLSYVTNSDNPHYLNQGKGGNNTKDKLFLLSIDEIRAYLPNREDRVLNVSEFAKSEGVEVNKEDHASWWLRSPGAIPFEASYVAQSGEVMGYDLFCGKVDEGGRAVRPALNLHLPSKKIELHSAKKGDRVSFGRYYKDDDKILSPLTWRVLEVVDGMALLITERSIDAKSYNREERNTYSWMFTYSGTWSVSTLRKWLNTEFFKTAFNSQEQSSIVQTKVHNLDSSTFGTQGGEDTVDRIFILNIEEAQKYFADDADRMAKVTKYAKKANAYADGKGYGYWWLRSVGQDQFDAAYVDRDGKICENGRLVYTQNHAVRAAMWIKTENKV